MTRWTATTRKWAQRAALVVIGVVFGVGALSSPSVAAGKAVILSINDVYRLKGVDEGRAGGMARVRALRAELERDAPDLLFLHGGDFLSPSFLGRSFKGRQMVDLMNVMDGDFRRGALDPRMFVVFGNHEFDDTHCRKSGPLTDLVTQSEFTWLASNLDFAGCEKLAGLAGNERIETARIVESGGLRVGLYGITLSNSKYADIVSDPIEVSCAQVKALRERGADVVVALTHLNWRTDLEVLGLSPGGSALPEAQRTCTETPDLVIGGHDHNNLAMPSAAPRLFKADADAVTAWVVEVSKAADGKLDISGTLRRLDDTVTPDATINRLADQWTARHEERVCMSDCITLRGKELKACLRQVPDGQCLDTEMARTNSLIETEEIRNRSFETGFGDWVADHVRAAGSADVAFLNSGGFRLNYDIPIGTIIRRRHLAQMFPFSNKLAVRQVTGADLWMAMTQSIAKRGEGGWAHFSGLAVEIHVVDGKQALKRMAVRRSDGEVVEVTRDSADTFSLASVSFVLANGDGHGFTLCPGVDNIWACKDQIEEAPDWPLEGAGADLPGFLELKLREAGIEPGLTLTTDARLCDPGQTGCLIDTW